MPITPEEIQLEKDKINSERELELLRAVMQFSMIALRTSILINGAAAIAVMTFMGNVDKPIDMEHIKHSLTCWCVGVFLSATAMVFGYVAQQYHLSAFQADNEDLNIIGSRMGKLSAFLIVLSICCFFLGLRAAIRAF